ncbi:anthranilate/para-aminobenzoate synthase component I [Bradyrhizobium sp. GM2.2]
MPENQPARTPRRWARSNRKGGRHRLGIHGRLHIGTPGRLRRNPHDRLMHVLELQWIEPVTAMRRLAHRRHLTVLDSASRHAVLGQYSYVTCDPFITYVIADGRGICNGESIVGDPWAALRALLANYPQMHRADLPAFRGGAAGFFGHELNRTLERLPLPTIGGHRLPQALLHLYDVVISFDHRHDRCWTLSTGWPEQDPVRRRERARQRAEGFVGLLTVSAPPPDFKPGEAAHGIQTSVARDTSRRYSA